MARDGEGDPYAAEGTGESGPVDIGAVRRDDALIDAIAGSGPVATDSPEEYQLASLLANWRAELVAEPLPADPELDVVVAAVNQEIGARDVRVGATRGGHLRLVRPILGAAAALALVFGAVTALSYNAAPGDPLWGVKEVVFSDQAQTTVVQRADGDLNAARDMLAAGDPKSAEQARTQLAEASENAAQVKDPVKRDDLMDRLNQLRAELEQIAPTVAEQLPPIEGVPPVVPTPDVPGTTDPGTTAPGTTDPGTTDPGTTDPDSGIPGDSDGPADPDLDGTPGPEVMTTPVPEDTTDGSEGTTKPTEPGNDSDGPTTRPTSDDSPGPTTPPGDISDSTVPDPPSIPVTPSVTPTLPLPTSLPGTPEVPLPR